MKNALFVCAVCLMFACKTPKDIAYFQTGYDLTEEQIAQMKSYIDPVIKVGDELTIVVSSSDPLAVSSFNLPLVSFVRESVVSSASTTSNSGRETSASQAMQTYMVNSDGNINFPVLGQVKVIDMRKQQVVDLLRERIKEYVKEPIVNLNIINYKVTVLGEVNRPGSYAVSSDRVSILDALGFAGDMTIYGDRKDVKVVRDVNGVRQMYLYDLTKSDFLADQNFYLQQNDVVYVEPNDKRKKNSRYSQQEQFTLSVVTAIVSVCSLISGVVLSLAR